MKKAFIFTSLALLVIGFATVALLFWQILQAGRPDWQPISNPQEFVRECRALASSAQSGPVEQKDWPDEIKKLAPLEVIVGAGEYVEMIISTGGIGPRFSYLVLVDPKEEKRVSMPEVRLHRSQYPDIFKLY